MNVCLLTIVLFTGIAGCFGSGSKEFPTAKTIGTVMCDGTPVANVRVYFNPKSTGGSALAGKSGWGTTDENGTFEISTYGSGDGAVVGMCNVCVDRPAPKDLEGFECECELSAVETITTVEIKNGEMNDFTIELPIAKSSQPVALTKDELEDLEDESSDD